MSWSFECPSCGETDDIRGSTVDGQIVLTCGVCTTSWPRDGARQCATCGSTDVRHTYRGVLSMGRASVTSMTGRQEVVVCETCDAEAIAAYTDRGHHLPPDYVTAALVPRGTSAPRGIPPAST